MTERTITFQGTITLAEAKRLIAEAEAQPVVEEGRLYHMREAQSGMRWRKVSDAWQFSVDGGASWSPVQSMVHGVVTGALVPYEPEPGVVYRHVETTEQEPHGKDAWHLYRLGMDGWQHKGHPATSEFPAWTACSVDMAPFDDIRYGRRIPYLAYQEPPRFAVGQWVQHKTQPWAKARQVSAFSTSGWPERDIALTVEAGRSTGAADWHFVDDLRPATDAEIAEAKRITIRPKLIVIERATGAVWYSETGIQWVPLNGMAYRQAHPLGDALTIDHYDILPNYLVEGAK